jgi:hypothetical protein
MRGFQPYQTSQSMMMMPIQGQSQFGEAFRAKSVEFLRAMSGEDLMRRGTPHNTRDYQSNSQMDTELGGGWFWSDIPNEVSLLMGSGQSGTGSQFSTTISSGYEVKSTGTQLKMRVLLDKPFKNNKRLGFNWHKSWNIPKITVKMEGQFLIEKLSEKMYLHAFAVKRAIGCLGHLSSMTGPSDVFQSIGLKGQSVCEITDEETTLSGLSFSSTSYIHTGSKFYLLLLVSVGRLVPGSKNNKILFCKISPEIYVDSRKSAREPENLKSKKLATFFQTFDPATYSKKKSQLPISSSSRNSLLTSLPPNTPSNGRDYTGVIEYLTAQNIRNKVRNPIFLAIRFPDCFSIHYNPVAQKLLGKNEEAVLVEFQSALKECFALCKRKKEGEMSTEPSPNSSMSNFFGSSDVLPMHSPSLATLHHPPQAEAIFKLQIRLPLGIDENHLNRKLVDLVLRVTASGHIGASYGHEGAQEGWRTLPNDEELLEIYTRAYDSMLMLRMGEDREKGSHSGEPEILIKKRSVEDLHQEEDSNLRVFETFHSRSKAGEEPLGAFLLEKKKKPDFLPSLMGAPNDRGLGDKRPFLPSSPMIMLPPSSQPPLTMAPNKLMPNPQLSLLAFNNIKSGQQLVSSIDNVNSTFKKAFSLSQQLLESEMSLANDARRSLVTQLQLLAQQQLAECTQATYTLIQSTNLMHSIIVAGDINVPKPSQGFDLSSLGRHNS